MKKKIKKFHLLKKMVYWKYLPFIVGLILIFLTSFLLYRDLFNTFFTQDEWWELGRAVDAKTQGIGYYFKPWGGHIAPLMLLLVNLQLRFFGTNIWPYAFVAILGHSLIAITLALFVAKLTKRPLIGWLSGLIFVLNTAPFHAVTYIAGGVTHIHGATFLFLISLIFFAQYVASGYRRRFLILSLTAIILAVLFIEYVAFYFFLAPLCLFIFSPKKKKLAFWLDQAILIVSGGAFFVFRFFSQKINVYGSQFIGARTVESSALAVNSPILDYFTAIIRNTQKLLPRSLYQVWMNEEMINRVTRHFNSQDEFLRTMPILMIAFIVFTYLILVKLNKRFLAKIAVAAALVMILGPFPAYIFPTLPNMIESRYLYAPSLGFSVFLALFLVAMADFILRQLKLMPKKILVYFIVIAIIITPLFKENYSHITGRLKDTVAISKMRQKILRQTLNFYPKIKDKSVFYATTNLNTPGIPWPVSLGYTLLVMHTYQGNYRGGLEFFRSNKLWPITEGYEEHGEYGFGLYYGFNNLMKIIKQYKLSEENVYAIRWEATPDSKRNLEITHSQPPIYEGEMVNITDEIRPIIKSLLQKDQYHSVESQVTQYVSPDIELSFDRQSKATFMNTTGVIETAWPGMPRLTGDKPGKQLGILIEGNSTNNLLFSEDLTNRIWEKSSELSMLTNYEIAPSGQKTAEKLLFKSKTDFIQQKVFYSIREPAKVDYTFSLYLKSSVEKDVTLKLINKGSEETTSKILVGPTWRRFELTTPLVIGGPIKVVITGVEGEIFAWGMQLEESSFATSYIATENKPEFRAGDVFRAYPKKSLPMNQGTISFWFKPEWGENDLTNHILFYNGESTSANSLKIEVDTGLLRFNIMDSTSGSKSIEQLLGQSYFNDRGWNQIIASWANGQMALYLNGQAVGQIKGLGTGRPKKGLSFSDPYRIGVHHGWYSMYADALISYLRLSDRQSSPEQSQTFYYSQKDKFE